MCCGGCCAACMAVKCISCCIPKNISKVYYLFIMIASTILALVFRKWGDEMFVDFKIWGWEIYKIGCGEGELQDKCVGAHGVYRVSAATAVFFLIMAIITLIAPKLNTKGFLLKIILLIGLIFGSFFVDNNVYDVYADVSRWTSFLFLLMQVILLIDFAHDWHEYWMEKADEVDEEKGFVAGEGPACGNKWKLWYLIIGFGAVFISLAFLVGFIFYFKGCFVSSFFAASAIVFGLGYLFLSLNGKFNKGLIPPAVVLSYCTFLTFSALSSNPEGDCNPFAEDDENSTSSVVFGLLFAGVSLSWGSFRAANSVHLIFQGADEEEETTSGGLDLESGDRTAALTGADKDESTIDTTKVTRRSRDDDESPQHEEYNPDWFFHVIMILAAMYMCMLLTNWGDTDGAIETLNSSLGKKNMWIKIVTMWVTSVLFTWTVVAEFCMPDRDFSDHNRFSS